MISGIYLSHPSHFVSSNVQNMAHRRHEALQPREEGMEAKEEKLKKQQEELKRKVRAISNFARLDTQSAHTTFSTQNFRIRRAIEIAINLDIN